MTDDLVSDADPEIDAYEQQLARRRLLLRAVGGVLLVAIGAAMFVFWIGFFVQAFGHGPRFGRRGQGMVAYPLIGLAMVVIGIRVLRRRGRSEGLEAPQSPVPLRMVLAVGAPVALVVGLGMAQLFGLLDAARRLVRAYASPCRRLITAADVAALGGPAFEIERVVDRPGVCVLAARNRTVRVEMRGDLRGSPLEAHLPYGPREAIAGLGERAYRVRRPGRHVIAFAIGGSGAIVSFSDRAFDASVVDRAVGILATREQLVREFGR